MHPYTRGLLGSLPRVDGRESGTTDDDSRIRAGHSRFAGGLQVHNAMPDRFEPCPDIEPALVETAPGHFVRCHLYGVTDEACRTMPILEVKDLHVRFPVFGGVLLRRTGEVRAVDGVSFTLEQGETLGLVGESGCGKTTVGRAIINILRAMSYRVEIAGSILYHHPDGVVEPRALSRRADAAVPRRHPDDLPGSVLVAQPADDASGRSSKSR